MPLCGKPRLSGQLWDSCYQGEARGEMVIDFGGLGAEDNVEFAVVPKPATMVLLGGRIVEMAVRFRRQDLAK